MSRATPRTRRNDDASVGLQVGEGDRPKLLHPADGPRDRDIECSRQSRLVPDGLLCAPLDDGDILELQVPAGSAKERDSLSTRFDQRQPNPRIGQPHRQPRNSAPRADIHHRKRPPGRKGLQEKERVDEQVLDDLLGGFDRGHPVHPVPAKEDIQVSAEQALIGGQLRPADVPGAWNAAFQRDFGMTPPTDALGCLQDIHWSAGLIGYFPTYTLGNLCAAQLYEAADRELGGLPALFERGDFRPLKEWLNTQVHQPGRQYAPSKLIERVTGRPLSADALLRHLHGKFDPLYGL